MIYCLSCEKYPTDEKVIPYGSTFPIDTFTVRLLANEVPQTMPTSGADVEGLDDGAKFAVGSQLYVTNNGEDSKVYIFIDGAFQLWDSPFPLNFD